MSTTSDGSIRRASALLASGTLVSRVLGFASAVFLTLTIGQTTTATDTFALANQLPNNIYAIIAGGLLSSVFVPAIVRASLHEDNGRAFINRLVTLGGLLFLAAGVVSTLAAPLLVRLYADIGGRMSDEQLGLATAFAYWCLPQVFFYALYSLLGEVLNARQVFGPFTWAPALNNVVVIVSLVIFRAAFGLDTAQGPAEGWTPGMVALLAGGATLGVASQAFALVLFWRRAGLHYRPDFHWRGVGLGQAGKAAAWTFGMILVTQLAGIVQSNVTGAAAGEGSKAAAYRVINNSWLIFMLPHSIAAVSIATAYFTRMATHHRDGRLDLLRGDLARSLNSIGAVIVFASVGLIVLSFPFSAVFSSDGFADVTAMAPVLIAFLVGLVPFSVLFVLRRTFYALDDTKTPFFNTLIQAAIFVVLVLFVLLLPRDLIAVGIASVTTIAGIIQTVFAAVSLRHRLGSFHGSDILRRHVQFLVACIPAAAVGILLVAVMGGYRDGGFGTSSAGGGILTMVVAGAVMALVYAGALRLLHNPQLDELVGPILARVRRGR
jgi:putative peptidoglycan lipid II flippase